MTAGAVPRYAGRGYPNDRRRCRLFRYRKRPRGILRVRMDFVFVPDCEHLNAAILVDGPSPPFPVFCAENG